VSGNPFAKLAEIKSRLPRYCYRPLRPQKKAAPPSAPAPSPAPPSDEEIFLAVMNFEGVSPLNSENVLYTPLPPSPDKFRREAEPDDDALALQTLAELVSGAGDFDLSFTDEYLEGHAKSMPPFVLRNLKEGRYPIQALLDLHGYTLAEAQGKLNLSIPRFSSMGYRNILLIHGRGLRSPDGIPVLKQNLGNLLLRSSIRKYILAFVTARPFDGGSGACYVLLRKKAKAAGRH
jgi:DNA-nicking Smr family endonuclease